MFSDVPRANVLVMVTLFEGLASVIVFYGISQTTDFFSSQRAFAQIMAIPVVWFLLLSPG